MIKLNYRYNETKIDCEDSDENIEINCLEKDGRYTVTVKAKADIKLNTAETYIDFPISRYSRVFVNGYQSWTETKEFLGSEKLNDLDLLPPRLVDRFAFKSYGSQSFSPMGRDFLLGFDYAYIRSQRDIFIGSRNYKNAYLMIRIFRKEGKIVLESDVFGKALSAGDTFTVFDYIIGDDIEKTMGEYFAPMKAKTDKKLFGYTSWYNHYQNINENIILKALDESDDRFKLFQIDDGYETFVGDWFDIDKEKFPNGLSSIVDKVHARGMKAGIWLAPLVAENKSRLFNEHRDFIRTHADGTLVMAGSNWSGFYALDLDKEEVVKYVKDTLEYYVKMGFDFFKLDFLYASNLSKMHDMTRAETSEFIYDLIRETLKDKIILGCGATLSNAYEKFEYMRVGPDISLKFDDEFYMRLFHPERISTKVTLCNTIFRSASDGHAYGNDPDVFLLRDEGLKLSKKQRYSILLINSLFGSLLMTSDNPKSYDEEKTALLDKALALHERGKVLSYSRRSSLIDVLYELDGEKHFFSYNMKKGVICDER